MKPQNITLKIDLRIICVVLLLIIAGMLAMWRPWQDGKTERKITVSGQASIKAEPDQYLFYPTFERRGTDSEALKQELNEHGRKIQTDLKNLGVAEHDIVLQSDSYQDHGPTEPAIAPDSSRPSGNGQVVTLRGSITVGNKELAGKVQDYLATTDAKGQLTAQAQFSDAKRKKTEFNLRQAAVEDAKKNAQQSAENLGLKVGKVLTIKDGATYGVVPAYALEDGSAKSSSSLPVTPGRQDVSVTVEVVFALR